MFTLNSSTELMKSHKAAQVLSDQSAFDVLQSSGGLSLFFGIGDTNILYLNVEQTEVATGWTPSILRRSWGRISPGRRSRRSRSPWRRTQRQPTSQSRRSCM